MWSDHTALMAFGTTMWGVNAAANAFGYWGYSNPYYYESYPVSGGAYVDLGTLTFDNCTVLSNTASTMIPGIAYTGATTTVATFGDPANYQPIVKDV